jgi:hypothetical protein
VHHEKAIKAHRAALPDVAQPGAFLGRRKVPCEKRPFEQFIYKNDHFAKTGSGRTLEKLRKKMALLAPR